MTPLLLTKKNMNLTKKNAGLKVSDFKACSLSCTLVYECQEWEFMRQGKLIFVMPWSTIFGVCESWSTDYYAYTLQDLWRLWVQARTSFKCSLRAKWYEAHVLFQCTCITLKPSKRITVYLKLSYTWPLELIKWVIYLKWKGYYLNQLLLIFV